MPDNNLENVEQEPDNDDGLKIEVGSPTPKTKTPKTPLEQFKLSPKQVKDLETFWASDSIEKLEFGGQTYTRGTSEYQDLRRSAEKLKNATYRNKDGKKMGMKILPDGRVVPEEYVVPSTDPTTPEKSAPITKKTGTGIKASTPVDEVRRPKLDPGKVEKSETLLGALWEMFGHWSFYPFQTYFKKIALIGLATITSLGHAVAYSGYSILGVFGGDFGERMRKNADTHFESMVKADGTLAGIASVGKASVKSVGNAFIFVGNRFKSEDKKSKYYTVTKDLADARGYFSTNLIVNVTKVTLPGLSDLVEAGILRLAARFSATPEVAAQHRDTAAFLIQKFNDNPWKLLPFSRGYANGTAGEMFLDGARASFTDDIDPNTGKLLSKDKITGDLGALIALRDQLNYNGTNKPQGSALLQYNKNRLIDATNDLKNAQAELKAAIKNKDPNIKFRTVEQIENSIEKCKKLVTEREAALQNAIAAKAKAANLSSKDPLSDPTFQARFGGQRVISAIKSSITNAEAALEVAVDPVLTINTNQPHPTADLVSQATSSPNVRPESTKPILPESISSVSTKQGYFSSLIDRFSAVMARFSNLRGTKASPTNNGLSDPMTGESPRIKLRIQPLVQVQPPVQQLKVENLPPSIALVVGTKNKPQG